MEKNTTHINSGQMKNQDMESLLGNLVRADEGVINSKVFTDPEIVEPEFLTADSQFQIFIEALRQWLAGIVDRHDKHAQSQTAVL